MRTAYFNTTETVHPELDKYEKQAQSQEDVILHWFRYYRQTATPSKLMMLFERTPITSIRRALTNLTNAGDLVKTDRQERGPYGRPEFVWRLAEKHDQREMF